MNFWLDVLFASISGALVNLLTALFGALLGLSA
jgi:hypothetical protein